MISALIFGCSKKGADENTEKVINIIAPATIKGFDPIHADDLYTSNEIARVYEGLLEFHYLKRPYTLSPNLAAALPESSNNGLTYTFKILPDVYFQDNVCFPNGKGRELTAEDFAYSIKRVADPRTQSAGWWLFDGKIKGLNEWRDAQKNLESSNYDQVVEGVKAIDKYTLQFNLAKANPQFLYGLAMPFSYVVARECVQHYGKEFLNHPVGTSAFVTEQYKGQSRITYTKNPTYRKKFYPSEAAPELVAKGLTADAGKQLPLVDKVVVDIMEQENTRWLNFKKGNADFLPPPKDNFDTAITPNEELSPDFVKQGVNLSVTPSLDVTYIAFNNHYALFRDNLKLRQAISMAYDSQKSLELFYNGQGIIAQSLIPPGIAGHVAGYKNPNKEYNVEKAKLLLAEAGYPGGKGLPKIVYDTSATATARQMSEFFTKQMTEIGLQVQVNNHPFPELQKRIANKQSMMFGIAWGADYPDAENFLQLLYGPNKAPGSNGSNYDNPAYNELFEKAVVMEDGPVRTALYEKLYMMAAEDVPWIFGIHRKSFVLVHGWLQNYVRTEFEQGQEKYLGVDNAKKSELKKKM
jgi:ABC-type transport system substrate-binding protein